MKSYRFTAFIKRTCISFIIEKLNSRTDRCHLCKFTYREVIGNEVTGKVTFIFHKIEGKAKDYVFPFRIAHADLEIHNGKKWNYAKSIDLLSYAIDTSKLTKWAGTSMLALDVEY